MTQVTGPLFDELGGLLADSTCVVQAVSALVGQGGGGRVKRGSEVVTDGTGIFSADIRPGEYILTVVVQSSGGPSARVQGRMRVPPDGPVTLESVLDKNAETFTPSLIAQAVSAATAATRAQSVASISEKTGDYTLSDADKGTLIASTGAGAVKVTIPTDASGGFTETVVVSFQQKGAGALSIAAAQGVTINGVDGGSTQMQQRYGTAQAIRYGADEWTIFGLTDEVAQ